MAVWLNEWWKCFANHRASLNKTQANWNINKPLQGWFLLATELESVFKRKRRVLWCSENSVWFLLRLRRLLSGENKAVGVTSRSGRAKPITKQEIKLCDLFIPLLLSTSIWFSLDHNCEVVLRGAERKWKRIDSSVALINRLTILTFDFQCKVILRLLTLSHAKTSLMRNPCSSRIPFSRSVLIKVASAASKLNDPAPFLSSRL